MRTLLVFFILMGLSAKAAPLCPQLPQPWTPQLSTLWAQELIGADLAMKIARPAPPVDVAVLDLSFAGHKGTFQKTSALSEDVVIQKTSLYSPHGVAVASLINHPWVGVSPQHAQLRLLLTGSQKDNLLANLQLVEDTNTPVVNLSLALRFPEVGEKINALAQTGTVFVTSAGNATPKSGPELEEVKRNLKAILVGSLDLNGQISAFSQEGENVAIYAPTTSDLLASLQEPYSVELSQGTETTRGPRLMTFGMTSAAAPMVTGVVASLKAQLPDLNFEQIRSLLRRTGVPIPGTSKLMLNALKAQKVAQRIKDNRLHGDAVYDFSMEALDALDQESRLQGSDCEVQAKRLELLRTAFLLTPSFKIARRLALIYQEIGLSGSAVYYQNWPQEIDPKTTDLGVQKARGSHLVYTTPTAGNGKLLITLGGTGSLPSDFRHLHAVALEKGYQVLAIDYLNSVVSTACRESQEPRCFDQFRSEIVTGQDVSDVVQVNQKNSILHRIRSLLAFLQKQDSRWSPFLKKGDVDWSKVVLVGHSQGAGHAVFLAKLFSVDRVLTIAGPQDNFNPEIAGWLKRPGKTPADRFYTLLHEKDFFGVGLQMSVFRTLVHQDEGLLQEHAIVSNKPTRDAHVDLIQPLFAEEWRRLL